jgi:hypothetical protein
LTTWCCAIAYGLGLQSKYEFTPGTTITADVSWPADSKLTRASDRPTLVMFVHPHCPCSRASLTELSFLAADCGDRMALSIVFVSPEGSEDGWEHTDLWEQARRVGAATVVCDHDAIEAKRFKVTTSGETRLFGADGRLLFQGGMTRARGHTGDNLGRAALTALVATGTAERSQTPVFGCALINSCCLKRETRATCCP